MDLRRFISSETEGPHLGNPRNLRDRVTSPVQSSQVINKIPENDENV